MISNFNYDYRPLDAEHLSTVRSWLSQPYVAEWFYGEGLESTLKGMNAFISGSSLAQYWLAYDKNRPFTFFITSIVNKPEDELTRYCMQEGRAITLDMVIGDSDYVGKGLSSLLIQEVLLSQFPDTTEVLIDPEATNTRAIHVYQKAGFTIIDKFIPPHSPNPHCMMRLNMQQLLASKSRGSDIGS